MLYSAAGHKMLGHKKLAAQERKWRDSLDEVDCDLNFDDMLLLDQQECTIRI